MIADESLRAVEGSLVALDVATRPSLVGKLVHFDDDSVTLVLVGSNEVVTVPRATITRVRVVAGNGTEAALDAEASFRASGSSLPEAPERPRRFGLHFGVTPSVMVDLDSHWFYGFANFNIVFLLANRGVWWTGSIGAGLSLPVTTRWKLDIFAVVPLLAERSDYVVAVGVGMHYTARSGFTFAFKLPALGWAFDTPDPGILLYCLSAAMGMPLVSVGCRF